MLTEKSRTGLEQHEYLMTELDEVNYSFKDHNLNVNDLGCVYIWKFFLIKINSGLLPNEL